jgi:putative membrane protein
MQVCKCWKPKFLVAATAAMLILSTHSYAASSLGSDDTDFIKNTAKGNLAEIDLGHMAVQKTQSPEVRDFANRMIRDHTKANSELATLASSKGVEIPKSISLGDDVSVAHLKMLSGKSFDDAYIKIMVDDHKKTVDAFQKTADNSQDPDVKHFAAKMLPTVQGHLTKIEKIQEDFGGGTK